MTSLRKQLKRAQDLGIEEEAAEHLRAFLDAAETSADAYEEGHWGEDVDAVSTVMLSPLPAAMWQLGELVRVEYDASKGGERARFYHDFEDVKPVLAVDPDNGQLYIVGGDYDVTSRGIVG